jgi:hypothetical protein
VGGSKGCSHAIWMLACTDADPIIAYRGIADRVLGSDVKNDEKLVEKAMNLVEAWPELFSTVIAPKWLEDWQEWVRNPTEPHYPRWVIKLHPNPDPDNPARSWADIKEDRDKVIGKLHRNTDVFRSRFRTRENSGVCTPEQVKLGTEHIERLRKAGMEEREERLKRITFWLPALSIVVPAIVTVAISYINSQPNENGRQTVRLTAEPAYASSLDAMQLAFDAAEHGDPPEMQKQLTRISVNLLRLEPLIEKPVGPLWENYKKFGKFCSDRLLAAPGASTSESAKAAREQFDDLYKGMREQLYHLLVDKGPE